MYFHSTLSIPILTICSLLSKLVFDLRAYVEPYFTKIYDTIESFSRLPLPSETFNALFSTFSNLFRHAHTSHTALIDVVYPKFSASLRSCNSEIQRAGGEAWSAVLRRLKGLTREHAIESMIKMLPSGDGVFEAWAIVSTCKVILLHATQLHYSLYLQGVSQSLHSSTSSVIEALLNRCIEGMDDQNAIFTLARRTITALTHHTSSPEGFEPVSSPLFALVEKHITRAREEKF